MVISVSRAMQMSVQVCLSIQQIEAALPTAQRPAFRRFVDVMHPPSDIPGCASVLDQVLHCVNAYRDSLGEYATESLRQLVTLIANLAQAIHETPLLPFSRATMWRRLSRSPAWGLFIAVPLERLPVRMRAGVGAEICWSWLMGSRFSESLADKLRLAVENGEDLELPTCVPGKKLASGTRTANAIFHTNVIVQRATSDSDHFAGEVRQWFRNRVFLASDKAQQAVFHHRTQSRAQFLASAHWLRQRAEAGDNLAIQACVGALFGLRADLVQSIPLLNAATEDYVVAIDVDTGCEHVVVSLFADGAASPPRHAGPDAIAASASIFVTPMPHFLAEALQKQRLENPGANTLGHLLPTTVPLDSRTRTLEQSARIAPSYTRFCSTFGPFAVSLNIDRYIAAVLIRDPRLTPSGKFFYARATREELWDAADSLFNGMGWGPAVPFVDGLAAGSQVMPTEQTIGQWFKWMKEQVETSRPGKSTTLEQIIGFHNVYAMAVASLLSFVLVLRERKQIPLMANIALGLGMALPIGDKRCGMVPGPRSIPLPDLANTLLNGFRDHIAATDRALADLGIPVSGLLRHRLRQILAGERVPLLTTISRGRHKAIGSRVLEKWWPQQFGLEGNHGRHFVQNNLRDRGVRSNDVDAYVRHILRGIAPCSTASTKSLHMIADALIPALNKLFKDIGLEVIPGLVVTKERKQ